MSPSELQAFIDSSYRSAIPQGMPLPQMVVLPKIYTATFPAIAVGATATQQIQIGANGDFFLARIRFRASIAGAAQTMSTVPVPNLRVLFTDSGSDEQWSNQAVDLSHWADTEGAGEEDLCFPRVISGRSTLTVQITSFEAAITPVLDISLVGVLAKLFGQSPLWT